MAIATSVAVPTNRMPPTMAWSKKPMIFFIIVVG